MKHSLNQTLTMIFYFPPYPTNQKKNQKICRSIQSIKKSIAHSTVKSIVHSTNISTSIFIMNNSLFFFIKITEVRSRKFYLWFNTKELKCLFGYECQFRQYYSSCKPKPYALFEINVFLTS